jgi:tRNA (cmo5U34)-methyltransferase
MSPIDNATAHSSSEYDQSVRKSIPYYDSFHEAAIDLVAVCKANPSIWIDTGCGTGTLVEKAYRLFPETRFFLSDPSPAMLKIAASKLSGRDRIVILPPVETKDMFIEEEADVITAIQSLHYQKPAERVRSVQNCYRLLKSGGVFVTFENIRPLTKRGIEIGKANWRRYEVSAGKSEEEAAKHIERFGVEYFPLTVEEHLDLLRRCNFSTVEILWYSYMQAGFYGMK